MSQVKRGILLLAAGALLATFLGACFPTAFRRDIVPDVWDHVPDASHAGNVSILVLAISEVYRAGHWAALSKTSGFARQVRAPIFMTERELKGLSAQLSTTSVDTAFIGPLGSWVETSNERVVEVCVIWPDGRFLSLGEPKANAWQRETRGLMTMPWQTQLLETASSAQMLETASAQGVCPYAGAKLDWDYAMRQRVIAYVKQVAIKLGPE